MHLGHRANPYKAIFEHIAGHQIIERKRAAFHLVMIRFLEVDIYHASKVSCTDTKYVNMTVYLLHPTYGSLWTVYMPTG